MRRAILIASGVISMCLATVGLVVPLLPTTPFLLLSAYCFSRSSPTLHRRLVTHPQFGPYIERYRPGRPLADRDIVRAVSVLWVSIGSSAILAVEGLSGKVLLVAIATSVSGYLISRSERFRPAKAEPTLRSA